MDAVHFIQANYWPLMAACAALFLLGVVFWIIGAVMQRAGERRMARAQGEPTGPLPVHEKESWYVYPPVMEHEYWSIEDV